MPSATSGFGSMYCRAETLISTFLLPVDFISILISLLLTLAFFKKTSLCSWLKIWFFKIHKVQKSILPRFFSSSILYLRCRRFLIFYMGVTGLDSASPNTYRVGLRRSLLKKAKQPCEAKCESPLAKQD